MLRVDLERRTVVASVRDLVAETPRPGGGFARARIEWGLEVHHRYREEHEGRTAGFAAEVPVELRGEVDGFAVHVTGRADGVIDRADALIVEEVKSSRHATAEHRRQLRLYALCLARAHPGRRLRARLLIDNRALEVPFDAARTWRDLEERVRAAIADARRRTMRAAERCALAGVLRFPYGERRPGQQAVIDAVDEGLAAGRPVLVEAPTGIGKTVSVMLPALRHALEHDARLFFLTAKTTQQRLAARTFLDLAPEGLHAVTLRAKAMMCPPGTLLCHPDHCAYLANAIDPAQVPPARHHEPDAMFALGEQARVCPHALSLVLAREADLVIGDFNYVYGPAAEADPGPAVVVVDEAHNLFDRVREHHSPCLARAAVAAVRGRFPPADGLLARLDACIAEGELRPETWAELRHAAVALLVRVVFEGGPMRTDDPLPTLLETVPRLHDAVARQAPEFVPYADGERLGVWCVNPAPVLREVHRRLLGCVAMSATLRPVPHWAEVLGLDDPVTVSVPSPFPPENRRVVIVPSVRTTLRERARHHARIARLIERVVAVRPGRYVAYFPSFAFLDAVRAHLRDVRAVMQQPGADRHALLDRLRSDEEVLLLAVLGGVFAEGIDVRGLQGAIVVGPGLPAVSAEREAMREYFDLATGEGWLHAMVVPGMQRVVQAAGRVHRAPDDRGVIVLLDHRFTQSPYCDHLPPDWTRYGPEELVADDPVPPLQQFWCP